MSLQDLTALKKDFYRRFPDLSYFDREDFNLFKVILDGLKVDYRGKGIKKSDFFHPSFYHSLKNALRPKRNTQELQERLENLGSMKDREFVFVDHSGRLFKKEDGTMASLYLDKMMTALGRNNMVCIVEKRGIVNGDYDICALDLTPLLAQHPFDKGDHELKDGLRRFYKKIAADRVFGKRELENIVIALEKFHAHFRLWKLLLAKLPQKKIYLLCHYHKEGALLAMKRMGRKVIELQHGLISENDLFYCIPPEKKEVAQRALFADKILVYGSFWKNKLKNGCEYPEEKVAIIGDYQAGKDGVTEPVVRSQTKKDQIKILVATQTFLHKHFILYIKKLSATLINTNNASEIIVKTHPSEKKEVYSELSALPNVVMTDRSIDSLLAQCDCQVSVYSTTLFEGIKYNVPGFSLYVKECKDYIEELARDGVSQIVNMDFNPVDVDLFSNKPSVLPSDLYAPFNVNELRRA